MFRILGVSSGGCLDVLRVILIASTVATVVLVIAAVFFAGEGAIDDIDAEAMTHYRLGETAKAIAVWEAGLREFPDSATLHYRLGTMLAVEGDLVRAAEHLEWAKAVDPERHEIRRELALCYLQAERLADAECELRALLAQADWFPEAHYFLGTIHEKQNRPDEAMKEYIRELNVNPSCTYAWAKVMIPDNAAVTE
jgi:tetratricopeptide (TPR) repeat protein